METIIDTKQECVVFQTRFDVSRNKLVKLKQIIETETYCSVLMNDCFNQLKEKQWDSEQASSEIIIQVIHMIRSMIEAGNNFLTQDEITDIASNIFLLAHFEGISFSDIALYAQNKSSRIIDLLFLSSEILDEIRKVKGYKINNNEIEHSKEIIKDRLSKMLIIVYNYSIEFNQDLQDSFKKMHQDNTMYLKRRLEEKNNGKQRNVRYI